jgi:hypothetical protein
LDIDKIIKYANISSLFVSSESNISLLEINRDNVLDDILNEIDVFTDSLIELQKIF